VETEATAKLFRHRQTKGAETDTPDLTSTAPHSYSTVKTIAQGMPGVSAEPVVTAACLLFCRRAMGCGQHPAFPAPSVLVRGANDAKLGRDRAAGMRSYALSGRRCEPTGPRKARPDDRLRIEPGREFASWDTPRNDGGLTFPVIASASEAIQLSARQDKCGLLRRYRSSQ